MPAFYPEGDDPKIGDAPNRSLQKINSLLKSIDTKTGSTTITGPVTVSNEVEVTNSTGNPIPVSGTVALDATSLAALENISVTFPATQNVNVTNAGLNVSVTNLPATQPVSLATVPSHAVTGPLTDTELRATAVPVSVKNGVPAITTTGINLPVTSFTASTKTITITNFSSNPVIGNFLLIANTKRGVIVHNSVDPEKICTFGSASYNGQFWSITATFPASVSASGMQDSDTFHVVYAPEAVGYPIASQVELVGRTQTGSRGSAMLSTSITGALLVDAGVTGGVGTASESAASTDTSTSGINGLLKRLLQRITTLIYPPFASGSFTNAGAQSSAIDCGGYDYLVQHISGGGGGLNRPIQWSNDNATWTSGGVIFKYSTNGGAITTGANAHWEVLGDTLNSGGGLFVIPVVGRYWRIGTGGTSGGGSWIHNWYLHKGPFPGIVEEGIGARNSTAATTDTSDVGLNGLFKRLLQRLTTLLPANLTVSSTRLLVDGSGVTQPTRETQPTDDYAINTTALASFSLSGSALQSASFDAGANADYVVISISGGGSSGALYYDLSTNNSTWDAGNVSTGFATYYDRPATSTTDAYSYKSASGTFFGGTLSGYSARLIVPLQQSTPGSGTQLLYRYIRLNAPASNGGWRYKFTSYKSVDPLLASSVPGNPSTTRVAGRVDVGYVSNLPALPTGANTIGSVNVLGGNATAVKVDGSAVTQPVSIASAPVTPVTDNGGSLTVDGTVTVNDMTSGNAKTKIVDSTGADVSYIPAGTAGTPSSSVLSIQGVVGGTAIGIIPDYVGDGIQYYLDNYGNNIPVSGTVFTYPQQGTTVTNSNFTSVTSASLVSAVANREVLTVYNEGAGTLFINVGASCSTTSYQVRLLSGDYWEAPAGQQSLQHSGIFGSAGTARVTQIS